MAKKPTPSAAPTEEKTPKGGKKSSGYIPGNDENLPVNWDEQLAQQAKVAAEMESGAAGGQFFSLKGGILSWNDNPLPGNAIVAVILDHVLENVFYEGEFDSENPTPPCCFAFGRDSSDMRPHEAVIKNKSDQHDFCAGCPMNQWGTADKGKGKACRNTRRLALIPAGEINAKTGEVAKTFEDAAHYESAGIGFLKMPVTSVKPFANFVQSVASVFARPPHGVIVKISVEPDAKTQFKVVVEPLAKCPDKIMPAIMKRHEEARALIEFPYTLEDDAEPAAAKKSAKEPKRPPVKKGRKY